VLTRDRGDTPHIAIRRDESTEGAAFRHTLPDSLVIRFTSRLP